jgi:hypothetical protein
MFPRSVISYYPVATLPSELTPDKPRNQPSPADAAPPDNEHQSDTKYCGVFGDVLVFCYSQSRCNCPIFAVGCHISRRCEGEQNGADLWTNAY